MRESSAIDEDYIKRTITSSEERINRIIPIGDNENNKKMCWKRRPENDPKGLFED